jgi:MFS family permease
MGSRLSAPTDEAQKDSLLERLQTSRVYRVFGYRDFRLLWTGAFLSFIGSWTQTVAQGYLVYQLTKSTYLLGLVSFFSMLPVTIVGPLAGSLTDTLDKRKLLVITQSVFATGALFLAAATYYGFVQYWHIVVTALVLGTVSAIEMPTRQSIVGRVVPQEDLPTAIPINALTFNLARLVGPVIGGILLTAIGPEACYLVNGLSFSALIFAGLAIKADLRATAREPQPIWDLVTEGALYTFRDVRLRTLFILEAIVSMFGLFYLTQMPAIAADILHVGKSGLASAYTVVGIGSIAALAAVMMLADRPIKALLIRVAMSVMAICLMLVGLTQNLWLAYVLFAAMGMCAVTQFNLTNTLFQTLSPERLRGRVLAMHVWALSGLGPFGVFFFGYLAQKVGLPIALQVGGACVGIGALYGWIFRQGLEGIH